MASDRKAIEILQEAFGGASPVPVDTFSQLLRQSNDNPGASKATSTIETADWYGNTASWIVTTFRLDAGRSLCFLQRSSAEGGLRLVLPPEVVATMARHRDQNAAAARRRQGRELFARRRERGDAMGNADALRKAREARAKKAKARKAGK